ncbi:receptor-type tyrosine-protein phosphatase H-like [Hippoglossus hippoglossus]|uniref:receptor-type tyrosine-protein phosphatase H-like n=1 Tax=Hippoglossus hippoglossus TaxID=8267 RepID=UPI00148E34AE|nr:receptor-type tyrosine-protein phosphatase H-like [Hippoglossus hippoglossus]
MTKFSLQDKICSLVPWALMMMMMHGEAEPEFEFFLQPGHLTWNGARNHCQVCFKELVTVTDKNTQVIAQTLTSDSWIGLRKHLPPTRNSNPSSMPWSHWANGDLLTYQNWYPGWPVLNSPGGETTEGRRDLCVATLSFGAWVEKNCSELLPYVCYDERSSGQVSVTAVTTSGATFTWQPVAGGISHYRVEVGGGIHLTANSTDLTYDLSNLTAGTRYSIQVFPVKCERTLNPQVVTFYTKPNKVPNLNVTMVTETSVSLSWNKPSGHVDFYQVEVHGVKRSETTEGSEVDGLTPGISHTFTVLSGLLNDPAWSEASHITTATKPSKVSNLSVSENTPNSLLLSWTPPEGNTTHFRVQAMNDINDKLFESVVGREWTHTRQEVRVTGLPVGTKITLSVVAIASGTVEADKVTIVDYTAPEPISNLILESTVDSLKATWSRPAGSYSSFNVTLRLDGRDVDTTADGTKPVKNFHWLKAGAKYTVIVRSVSGHLQSQPLEKSKFTLPRPSTGATVISTGRDRLTFQWTAPDNIGTPTYLVTLTSIFWDQHWSFNLVNISTHTFQNLTSGTRYTFQVRTVTDEAQSSPVTISHLTADHANSTAGMSE